MVLGGTRAIRGCERGACIRPLRTPAVGRGDSVGRIAEARVEKHVGGIEARRCPLPAECSTIVAKVRNWR
jgi:hypothetical protein